MKRRCMLLLGALIILTAVAIDGQPYVQIKSIDDESAQLVVLEQTNEFTVTLQNLVINHEELAKSKLVSRIYARDLDLFNLLLARGIAKLEDASTAPVEQQQAEQSARLHQLGMWKPVRSPKLSEERSERPKSGWWRQLTESVGQWWDNNSAQIFRILAWLVGAGVAGFILSGLARLVQWLIVMYRQKKVQLVLIGEISAGKSALHRRIRDPRVSKNKIRNITTSKASTRWANSTPIRRGRFEIFTTVVDVAGTRPGDHWDEFLVGGIFKMKAFVLILAPSESDQQEDEPYDKEYIAEQLGYTRAMVQGALMSTKTKKPKCVLVFLNKFDLVSRFAPGDSQAEEMEKKFTAVFREHIGVVVDAAKRADVPCDMIVGSALEGWQCGRLVDLVARTLYGD